MVLSKLVFGSFKINRKLCTKSIAFQEKRIQVRGVNLNYTTVGTGPHVVFCVPGGIGTMETDFRPQLEGFDRSKFTLVAYDPPGYGKSRPPERDFSGHFYERDADFGHDLMKTLRISKYSILGWSAGSAISMIHAAKYPEAVNKLVIFGAHSFITDHELDVWIKLNDLKVWSEQFAKTFLEVYEKETLLDLWKKLMGGITRFHQTNNGNICKDFLKDIRCPTYILHGEKDKLIGPHHISYLKSHIKDCRIHLYPEGKHNIHLRYTEDFNKRVQEFLLQTLKKLTLM